MIKEFSLCMNDYILQHRAKVTSRYYVYVHRRKTDNSVFYVGKGTSSRAWNFQNRNEYWQNTSTKHGVTVEIVYDGLTEKEALDLEIDLIEGFSTFGSKLCNLTSGGESPIFSDDTRKKLSMARKGRRFTPEHRKSLGLSREGKPREDMVGQNNINCDSVVYTFSRLSDGEIFTGTRLELCKTFNLDHYLLRGLFLKQQTRKSNQGWKLLKETNGTN